MKQIAKWHIFAVAILAFIGSAANGATLSGSISGTVKDKLGRPLIEASVSIHDGILKEKILKTTKTDKDGRFVATNLNPGSYMLLAQAVGYKSSLIASANVVPHKTAVFEFKLSRASDLLTPEQDAESYKYVMRRNRHIFQIFEEEEPQQVAEKTPFNRETHGIVKFTATKAFSDQPTAASFAGLDFALAQMISENLELLVSGQTGIGRSSPQRLDTQASVLAGDDHQFTLSIGYGHLPAFTQASPSTPTGINQYTVRATDRWHIAGPVVIVYGFDYSRFDGIVQKSQISPRINFDLQVNANNQLFAAIYSPAGADIVSSEDFETTSVDFHGPVELINFDPQNQQSRRYEVGFAHTFKDRSRLETALFWDNVAGRSLGIMEMPAADDLADSTNNAGAPVLTKLEQQGHSKGLRIVFKQPITNSISASVGYAVGQGQKLDISNRQPQISVGYFQVFTGKVDAQFASTGTRISAMLRLATPGALLAIDPFQERLRALDPNISIYVTQSMPMFTFIPGRWEAMLDARNLLDSGNGDGHTQVMFGQYWRTVRGGFSVRF